MPTERLQKVLAAAGVASRRASENLIVAGRVTVNGVVVTELGSRVDPEVDKITVNGSPIQVDVSMRYVMLNKPTGVVSTMSDENGRRDLTEHHRRRLDRLRPDPCQNSHVREQRPKEPLVQNPKLRTLRAARSACVLVGVPTRGRRPERQRSQASKHQPDRRHTHRLVRNAPQNGSHFEG